MKHKIALVGEAWGERTVLLDEEDYMRVIQHTWCATYRAGIFHAMRKDSLGRTVFMHRYIMGLRPGDGIIVDHINGDGLDNRRVNLRLTNKRGNALNSERSRNAKVIERHGNRWRLRPFINGVRTNLGSFTTEKEALEALQRYRDASI